MKNSRSVCRHLRCWAVATLLAAAAPPALAETLNVTTTADSGPGSLRQAMLSAMASPQASTITFAPSANGVVTLASPLPDLLAAGGELTITGNGAANTVIDGNNQHRPFHAEQNGHVRFTVTDPTLRGAASIAATANGGAGGPYAVTARLSATQSANFSLTNLSDACDAFAFPYTLAGADNAARVAELRQAIECANANASDDTIDLGGNTLVFANAPYTSANGANALPIVTSVLTLRSGALERDASAATFRFLSAAAGSNLSVRAMQLRKGASGADGGAIRADGTLTLEDSVFEDNRAATLGGAISSHAMTNILTSRFTRNAAPDGAAIAGGDGDAIPGGDVTLIANSRIENNGGAGSRSVIWNKSYLTIVTSLVANNHLSAANSSLMFFHEDAAVAEFRNVTIADNTVTGALFLRMSENVQLNNCIVWDNQYASLGTVSARNSILPGVPAVSGNLDLPPGFVGDGDYHLDSGSPAIDAGDNGYGYPIGDLDQNPRPVDDPGVADTGVSHNGDPVLDIGAYERQTASAVAGITVTPTSGLVTTEASGAATFTVVLDRYPKADVTLSLSSSDISEGAVAPTSLTFTQTDWNRPRTISVIGMDDGIIDGDQAYTITLGVLQSVDPAYAGIDPPDVSVVNIDDEENAFHVGGSVIGLSGSGLKLSLNGSEIRPVTANGGFSFTTTLATGDSYAVTVANQPQTPAQTCVVANGSGTIGSTSVGNVVVNCGASVSYTIGGTVSGLSGGGLVLQLNGGGDLALSANGPYAFAPRLVDGASYLVTVKSQPQGRLCTLANATGTVQGTDVGNVGVRCAPLLANLQLQVDDGHAYARYGQVRDYFVTLGNTGNIGANDVSVAATFSAAFDVPNLSWSCLDSGSGCTTPEGGGNFDTLADVPANGSVTWIVSVPVRGDSNESEGTVTVAQGTPSGTPAGSSDTNTLVVFRDGLDVPYGDGAQAVGNAAAPSVLDGEAIPVEWPALPDGEGIHVVGSLQTPSGRIEVQRLAWRGIDRVRLLGTDASGGQRASAWVPVARGARLATGYVAIAVDAGIVLLEGATRPLALSLGGTQNHGEVE